MTTVIDDALSVRDRVRQSITPTLMVPKDSDLPACKIGQTRYLMASSGLFIETRMPWGSLVKQLWLSERVLPYGDVCERDDFAVVFRQYLMPVITDVMVPQAAVLAEKSLEWGGFIVWNGDSFIPWAIEMSTGPLHAAFTGRGLSDLPAGSSVVCDIHSHHTMPPFFSRDDDKSDKSRVKVALVMGNYRCGGDGQVEFDILGRYCVEGHFFDNISLFDEEVS